MYIHNIYIELGGQQPEWVEDQIISVHEECGIMTFPGSKACLTDQGSWAARYNSTRTSGRKVALHTPLVYASFTLILMMKLYFLRSCLVTITLALLLSGCATPVGVKVVDSQEAYRIQTESALATGNLSEPSKKLLRRHGLLDQFEKQPTQVIAQLHRGLKSQGDEDRLFALAELAFLQAERAGDRAYFLASAVYAWALLFPEDGTGVQIQPSDPRLRLAYDFYNQALAHGLGQGAGGELRLQPGRYPLPFGTLEISLNPSGLIWGGYRLEHFVPTTSLEVRGFRNRYKTPGLGAPVAASLARGPALANIPGAKRIGPRTKVPVTVLLRLDRARASLASGRLKGRLELFTKDETPTVTVDGRELPLESDPTAALAYQLEGNPLYSAELIGLLRGGLFQGQLPKDRSQDGLFMVRPYRAGKIPIVLVHGTASSPLRWAELINELQGDPEINAHYQIWVFTYDSGNPLIYSAGRLRQALTDTVQELDPQSQDPALRRMVVIGHSQGGLLTKLTAIDSGTRFWNLASDKPFESLKLSPESRDLLRQSFFFTPLPFVERVIFVATPHRGALMASGRIGAIGAWLITLPVGVVSRFAQAATLTGDEKLVTMLRRPPTAIDSMNPEKPGIKVLASIPVSPRIPAHSIIAVEGGAARKPEGDDGVVAYRSAHIDKAASELIVNSAHSCQGQPETIEEIRRILNLHAATPASVLRP